MSKPRVELLPEQLYVVRRSERGFVLGDKEHTSIPWHLLAHSHLYALSEEDMKALLVDAASLGYMVMNGSHSARRGLRGFGVGIGAWGHGGIVECRTIDTWCIDVPRDDVEEVPRLQALIRNVCRTLNGEQITFRSSALRWLSALYGRVGRMHEPNETFPPPLPPDVARMCRQAHVGGPIVHVRTTLEPYVSLDRSRAYGEAMLQPLPSGECSEVDLGTNSLMKWHERGLMRAMGVAEATVQVEMGPMVPLLPVMRWHAMFDRSQQLYPTGALRGCWTMHELAYLEASGRGHVEKIHRAVVFDKAEPFADMIQYMRRIEPQLKGVLMKRLEHMLYGKCARGLSVTKFGSTRSDLRPMPQDLVDSKTVERLTSRVKIRKYALNEMLEKAPKLPIYQLEGELTDNASFGTMDRPDRSAWITATNRIAMSQIIDRLDDALGAERSGSYVGRVYVDGVDIEARPDQVPAMEGVEVRRSGPSMRIYRAGIYTATLDDETQVIESAGLLPDHATVEELEGALAIHTDHLDGGPLAGGRHWSAVGGYEDPRMAPGQTSEPLHLGVEVLQILGFSSGVNEDDQQH
jgi:hypothetical protein